MPAVVSPHVLRIHWLPMNTEGEIRFDLFAKFRLLPERTGLSNLCTVEGQDFRAPDCAATSKHLVIVKWPVSIRRREIFGLC
jgi:hypothetical protein